MLKNYKFYRNKTHKKFVYNTLESSGEIDYYRQFDKEELIFLVLNNDCRDQYGTHYAKVLADGIPGYVEIVKDRPFEFELVI